MATYNFPHEAKRVEAARRIFIKQHEYKKRRSPMYVIQRAVPYSVGFFVGGLAHSWYAWGLSIACYFASFYFFVYLADTWKIGNID